MKNTILFLLLFITTKVFSQNQFNKGAIIDSIAINNTEKETFALYLPNSYNKQKPSSIVFIFDPRANGKKGIRPFIKASEKYGQILVCSNNSRNGSYDKNFKIFNNLSYYIHTIFKIDKDNMYLSGFSGGSRLAAAIANITNVFSGVIACGAGSPQVKATKLQPTSQKYNYVALCGNRDFNYDEMTKNKDFLDKINFNNTLITYKGNHSWPDEDKIVRAFNWLNIQKIKKDSTQVNKKKIIELYKTDFHRTLKHQENNELIFAFENYQRILKNYGGFFTLDSIDIKFKELKNSKNYKKQLKSLYSTFKNEKETKKKLLDRFMLNIKKPNNSDLLWWRKELKKLKKLENSNNSQTRNMAYRIKFNVYAGIYSTIKYNSKNLNKEQQNYIHKLLQLIKPKFYQKSKGMIKTAL